jgi:hypothetical protein
MGPWVFATAILLSIGALCVKYPAFRKYLLLTICGLLALSVCGFFVAKWAYSIKNEKRKSMIEQAQVDISALRLALPADGSSLGQLMGEMRNSSRFNLSQVDYKIIISRCVAQNVDCKSIYSIKDTSYIDIPANETRKINQSIVMSGVPEMRYWSWSIFVTDVWAE